MPRRPKKPSAPTPSAPPPVSGQRAWQAKAMEILEKTTGSRVTTMRPKEWTRLYVSRATAEEAARAAAGYQRNSRLTGKRKR